MQGIEISHCNAGIKAISEASYALWQSSVEEALRPVSKYGKSDTLGMDAMPEIAIIEQLQEYDELSVVITEETGRCDKSRLSDSDDPQHFRTVFLSDPTDRSVHLKAALENAADKTRTVMEVISEADFRQLWEKVHGNPIAITGASSAITCVRRGMPIFSVIVNYITRQLFLACSAGCYVAVLPKEETRIDFDWVVSKGKRIFFRTAGAPESMRRFVTFMGKSGYKENFIDSRFMTEKDMKDNLHYDLPGGPSRVLYLSSLQPADQPIGFILANGEKITEWIHWLTFLSFGRKENDQGKPALRLFEIYQDRPFTREGILMSTSPAYSIFREIADGRMVIDVSKFASFNNPSQMRSTLILTYADNQWATRIVKQYGYRAIEF